MTAASQKPSKSLSQNVVVKSVGIVKQIREIPNQTHEHFSVEGIAKPIVPASVTGNTTVDGVSTRCPTLSQNKSCPDSQMKDNHTECIKSINDLKQQVQTLKKESLQMSSELQKAMTDINSLTMQNSDLYLEKEKLKKDNVMLKTKCQMLSDEFEASRDQWEMDKKHLEKELNEIQKRFENKIIEIRQKHKDEVQSLEEKNRLLKSHLANSLNMFSIERQHEIDRLSKELEKSQASEEDLRARLTAVMEKYNGSSKLESESHKNPAQSLKFTKPEMSKENKNVYI